MFSSEDFISNQNTHSLNYIHENNNTQLKLILILLEKAEQILSIINLPESAIQKYNKLKEITFSKCSLDFHPLIKKNQNIPSSNNSTTRTNINNKSTNFLSDLSTISSPNSPHLNINQSDNLKNINLRKNYLIELLIELLEKGKLENIKLCKNTLIKDLNELQKNLENISLISSNSNFNDPEFDLKIEELKLNEYIRKTDMQIKSIFLNINSSSFQKENDFDIIIQGYKNKIDEMKQFHNSEITQYLNKFNELKIKYNPNAEEDLNKCKNYLSMINRLISPIYEKYHKKKISMYEQEITEDFSPQKELTKVNFLICFIEQLFKDNKHLLDNAKELEKEKQNFDECLNLPFVINSIKKNDLLQNIYTYVNNIDISPNKENQKEETDDINICIDYCMHSITKILEENN